MWKRAQFERKAILDRGTSRREDPILFNGCGCIVGVFYVHFGCILIEGERMMVTEMKCERLRLLYIDCAKPPPPPSKTITKPVRPLSLTWQIVVCVITADGVRW